MIRRSYPICWERSEFEQPNFGNVSRVTFKRLLGNMAEYIWALQSIKMASRADTELNYSKIYVPLPMNEDKI